MKRLCLLALCLLLMFSAFSVLPVSAAERGEEGITWYDEEGAYTGDYAFSLAVVGDTQTLAFYGARDLKYGYDYSLPRLYEWIAENVEAKNMQYVLGLGDITEKGEDWGHKNNDTEAETLVGDKEWAFAKEAISKLDGVVPYTLIRGSGHDGKERFNQWFGDHTPYTENITGYYEEGRIENVYHLFEVNGLKYMILCLDFGAKDPILEWANEVVAEHSDYRVIVTTHGYMEKDGTLLETGEAYCPSSSYYDVENNDGDDFWEKLVSKHENIFLVISGHMSSDEVVIKQTDGENGNTVTQMLIDPQALDKTRNGGYGMVAMLYFSEDGESFTVEYYSTVTDQYQALRTVEVNHKHTYTSTVTPPTCSSGGITTHTCTCGESYRSDHVSRLPHTFDDQYDAECNGCGWKRTVPKRPEAETEEVENAGEEEKGSGCGASGSASAMATPLLFSGGAAALCVNLGRRKRKK